MMGSLFLVFGYIGVPVAFALTAGVMVATMLTPISLPSIIGQLFNGIDSEALMAVPFFLLVGELMTSANVVMRMITCRKRMVGHIRGGLAQVVTVFSMFFSGMSGSSSADVAVLTRTMAKPMEREGYDPAFTAALIAAASTIANLVPPSIMAVVYGAIGNVSIGGLFLGGVVPGVLVGIGLMIYCYFFGPVGFTKPRALVLRVRGRRAARGAAAGDPDHHHGRHPDGLVHPDRGRRHRGRLHPLRGDPVAQPRAHREAAARFRPCRADLFAAADHRGGGLGLRLDAGLSARSRSSSRAGSRALPATIRITIMFLLVAVFTIVGDFIDAIPAIIIFMPIVNELTEIGDINPVHMGVVLIVTLAFGLITPPYGLALLMASKFVGVRFSQALARVVADLHHLLRHDRLLRSSCPMPCSGCPSTCCRNRSAASRSPTGTGYICPE